MAQSGPAAASLEGVSVLRNRQRLLSAVNWQVQPGARWAVVGPNGAGKSTLLRLLNTELFPTTGTVTLFGQARSDTSTSSRYGPVSVTAAEAWNGACLIAARSPHPRCAGHRHKPLRRRGILANGQPGIPSRAAANRLPGNPR